MVLSTLPPIFRTNRPAVWWVLLSLSTLPISSAHADVDTALKACFEKPDVAESKKCLTDLRDNDEINRVRSPAPEAKTLERAPVDKEQIARVRQHAVDIRAAIKDNLEPSYFTAGSGVHFGGDRTTTGMLYEAQVFQNFEWLVKSIARKDASGRWDFWLDLPVRIGVRQLSANSYPVHTPTFNPGIRLFAAKNDGELVKAGARYASLGLHHYSNGQEDDTLPNASFPNLRSGSFNTNYVEGAVHVNLQNIHLGWTRLAFRQQFYGTWEPVQRDQYPKRHVSLQLRPGECETPPCKVDFRWTGTYAWGYGYVVKPGIDLRGDKPDIIPGTKAGARDKLTNTIELSIKPNWLGGLSWYLRYDSGYDYYNINFQNRINRLQSGFVVR